MTRQRCPWCGRDMLLVARRSHWPDGTIHVEWVCPDCGKRCDTIEGVGEMACKKPKRRPK